MAVSKKKVSSLEKYKEAVDALDPERKTPTATLTLTYRGMPMFVSSSGGGGTAISYGSMGDWVKADELNMSLTKEVKFPEDA